VVCTFTRKAAYELRGRLLGYGVPVSTPAAAGGVPTPGVRAGTAAPRALRPAPGLTSASRSRTIVDSAHG